MSVNSQTAAGVAVPDTKLAREATELVRGTTTDLVYNHSRRVYFWGSLQGRNRDLSFDAELLYIGAMFHDLGLNEEFRHSGQRFEVDSADEARRFLQGHGVPEDSICRVWTASHPSRRQRSATSRPTSWSGTSPVTSAATSSTSS
jgi:HD superfamily phosphodiesterase